jgi:hypothetical protein
MAAGRKNGVEMEDKVRILQKANAEKIELRS